MNRLKIGFAQVNPTVGDFPGNTRLLLNAVHQAERDHCDLVIFPELCLTGYPPEDLLLKPSFIKENQKALQSMARDIKGAAVIGFVDEIKGKRFNAAAWIEKGRIQKIYRKRLLPNYGVFDEKRYFSPGDRFIVQTLKGVKFGLTICEDIWCGTAPLKELKSLKPDFILNISGSPFHAKKIFRRLQVAKECATYVKAPLAYCNIVGGQDELVFDGGSFVMDEKGRVRVQAPQFEEGLFTFEWDPSKKALTSFTQPKPLTGVEEIYKALVLGLRDYVKKNGFEKVTLGLSGGIDSSLVAALAVEALGGDQVVGVTMPSRFNINETRQDAALLAENLGIRFMEIPIQGVFEEFLRTLKPAFEGAQPNLAEENLQARIRGTLLMALSNKFNWLVLTTSNKSETSTGYATLYGDTAGGLAVLKDVLKTTVYDLARFINKRANRELIPESVLTRPPTAELRENQKDEDSLGAYAALDPIIVDYVEDNKTLQDILKKRPGQNSYIQRITSLIDRSEYKRRQGPPGIKITPHAFGRDHRMPITNRYKPTI